MKKKPDPFWCAIYAALTVAGCLLVFKIARDGVASPSVPRAGEVLCSFLPSPAHEPIGAPAPVVDTSRTVLMEVTAYCRCKKCCGPNACGITASGQPVSANAGCFCAADRSIPFGTMIDIPGYGCVPVLDRGGAIRGNRLDVYFDDHAKALEWGRQRLLCQVEDRP